MQCVWLDAYPKSLEGALLPCPFTEPPPRSTRATYASHTSPSSLSQHTCGIERVKQQTMECDGAPTNRLAEEVLNLSSCPPLVLTISAKRTACPRYLDCRSPADGNLAHRTSSLYSMKSARCSDEAVAREEDAMDASTPYPSSTFHGPIDPLDLLDGLLSQAHAMRDRENLAWGQA